MNRFLGDEAYSYVFQGQSGYLDHALANPALTPLVTGLTEWHINADEPVALDYNVEWTASIMKTANQHVTLYAPDPFRSSDHDPLIVGLNPLCGDLDDDGDVDVRDFRLILGALASKSYTARADYHSDGRVDARDLGIWVRCELEFKSCTTSRSGNLTSKFSRAAAPAALTDGGCFTPQVSVLHGATLVCISGYGTVDVP